MKLLERIFHLSERQTTVSRELWGGMTTFCTMAYIMVLIPNMLSESGINHDAAVTAVCLTTAICSIGTGLIANSPFALAPGIGFATIFTYTVCAKYGYSWQQALALVFLSGVLFLIFGLTPLGQRVTEALPKPFKFALSAGVGLFLTLSALIQAGIITADNNLLDMGKITDPGPLISLGGIFLTAVLLYKKVPCAIMLGMGAVVLVGIPFGIMDLPDKILDMPDLSILFLQMDFGGLLDKGLIPFLSALLALVVSDTADTVGTLLGVGGDAKMTDSLGDLPKQNRILQCDAAATCLGSMLGTCNVTSFAESATGIREGARTGLASVTVGILFLLALPFAPLLGAISSVAMAGPLVMVGMGMMSGITQINWKHIEVSLPCFLLIMGMPFTFSITIGIMLGVVSYVVIMVCRKRADVVDPVLYVLTAIFLLMAMLRLFPA